MSNQVNRVRESVLATLRPRGLRIIDTRFAQPDLGPGPCGETISAGGKSKNEYLLYKEKPSWSDGRQNTFRDSILLFFEAIDPGNDIFEETGEIPVILWHLGSRAKKNVKCVTNPSYIHIYPGFRAPAP